MKSPHAVANNSRARPQAYGPNSLGGQAARANVKAMKTWVYTFTYILKIGELAYLTPLAVEDSLHVCDRALHYRLDQWRTGAQ
jgi:hypothetical protein